MFPIRSVLEVVSSYTAVYTVYIQYQYCMNRVILRPDDTGILGEILYTGIYTRVLIAWRSVGSSGATLGVRSDK